MIKSLIKTVSQSVGIGSFIFLFSLMTIEPSKTILSVWIASALIGIASILYYTKVPTIIATVVQLVVGITAFTIVAIMNRWITMTITNIILYASAILAIMIIIQLIFYIVSLSDSKQINQKLDEKYY